MKKCTSKITCVTVAVRIGQKMNIAMIVWNVAVVPWSAIVISVVGVAAVYGNGRLWTLWIPEKHIGLVLVKYLPPKNKNE
jgi:hypothetical protein